MKKENNIIKVNNDLELIDYGIEDIKSLICVIRGKYVLLDNDVAKLYHYETKRINEAVRRNIERFPENFCFQLTEFEVESLRSQFATLKTNGRGQHKKYLPYAFTEQGIAMLSGLLKNEIAVQVSINVMNAFVEMRKFLANYGQVFERLTNVEYKLLENNKELSEHNKKFEEIFNELQKEKQETFKQQIFFNGQIYDAYSLIIDLIKRAKEKILIIDNYIDDSILKMLAKKNKGVSIAIITSDKSNISKLDIQKFNKEYPQLIVGKSNKFHDRFIVIDNKELYHIGASLKDLGKKCFAISKIEDNEYIDKLISTSA